MKAKSIGCGGLPVIMAPISIFSDDTSGNKSKVWNKFNSWNFLLAGLSRKDNAKLHNIHFICASNKKEALHTLVLGPYKYMLRSLMARFSPHQRKEVLAHIASFPLSGFELRLSRDISKYYKSFVGRDFKTLAQLALFVFSPLVSPGETEVWLALSKVHVKVESMKSVCLGFAQAVDRHCPELRSKLKIHLLLHLPDHMLQFGPPSGFNTERYSFIVTQRLCYLLWIL